jgi:carbon storage regulator
MLVLNRKLAEAVVLPDCGVTVTVLSVEGGRVRLGVSAPRTLSVHRKEVWERICREDASLARPLVPTEALASC